MLRRTGCLAAAAATAENAPSKISRNFGFHVAELGGGQSGPARAEGVHPRDGPQEGPPAVPGVEAHADPQGLPRRGELRNGPSL